MHPSHLQLDLGDGVEWDPAGLCAGLAERLVPHKRPSVVGYEADDAARRLLRAAAVVLQDLQAVREHDLHSEAIVAAAGEFGKEELIGITSGRKKS